MSGCDGMCHKCEPTLQNICSEHKANPAAGSNNNSLFDSVPSKRRQGTWRSAFTLSGIFWLLFFAGKKVTKTITIICILLIPALITIESNLTQNELDHYIILDESDYSVQIHLLT